MGGAAADGEKSYALSIWWFDSDLSSGSSAWMFGFSMSVWWDEDHYQLCWCEIPGQRVVIAWPVWRFFLSRYLGWSALWSTIRNLADLALPQLGMDRFKASHIINWKRWSLPPNYSICFVVLQPMIFPAKGWISVRQGGKMNRGLIVVETGVALMKHQDPGAEGRVGPFPRCPSG